jgi:undecaprenyl diphosphate synthase
VSDKNDQMRIPRHVAIVMDGNGRWARQQGKPRTYGHRVGSALVHEIVQAGKDLGIEVLTLFAFSSENWKRPKTEVSFLMDLFIKVLRKEIDELMDKNVQVRIIGQRDLLPPKLLKLINDTEEMTRSNDALILQIALSYGGRWDITNATKKIAARIERGELKAADVDEACVAAELSFSDLPEVDLFIRTGGELRISNFILWQAAYAEFYFTEILWPDFHVEQFHKAVEHYSKRQRRFGLTGEQVTS